MYKNKYRVPSSRLENWDYGSHGVYFVTVCTKNRVPYFGEIGSADDKTTDQFLKETVIGRVALDSWLSIPNFHPYVELDEFVIMPDHLHGILFINKPDKESWEANKFGPQSKNLASIIRGYKSSVKYFAVLNNIEFEWQPRYYDRVVRTEEEHQNIRNYIFNNPANWVAGQDIENLFIK